MEEWKSPVFYHPAQRWAVQEEAAVSGSGSGFDPPWLARRGSLRVARYLVVGAVKVAVEARSRRVKLCSRSATYWFGCETYFSSSH